MYTLYSIRLSNNCKITHSANDYIDLYKVFFNNFVGRNSPIQVYYTSWYIYNCITGISDTYFHLNLTKKKSARVAIDRSDTGG